MLDSIFAETKKVKYNEAEIEIKQISIGDIPTITKLVKYFTANKKSDLQTKVMSLVEEDFDLALDLFSRLTNISKENAQKLSLDATAFILSSVIKENADFFQRKVVPMVSRMIEETNGLLKSKG
jgi:uncharacterized protein YjaG (DUF416 family)